MKIRTVMLLVRLKRYATRLRYNVGCLVAAMCGYRLWKHDSGMDVWGRTQADAELVTYGQSVRSQLPTWIARLVRPW